MTRNAVKETVFAFPIRPGQSLYLEILFPS